MILRSQCKTSADHLTARESWDPDPCQVNNLRLVSAYGAGEFRPYVMALARHHGVALGRLLRENELSTRSTIFPGQTLRIPN